MPHEISCECLECRIERLEKETQEIKIALSGNVVLPRTSENLVRLAREAVNKK